MPANTRIAYVLINGPKSTGKTQHITPWLCEALRRHYSNVISDSFAAPMKHFIATALSAKYSELNKEAPIAELQGYSVREFLISLSEDYMKVRYGDDIFGRLLHYRVLRINPIPRFVISDDCGFEVERESLPSPTVVRVVRPGHDFSGDNRSYLQNHDYELVNDGDLNRLHTRVQHLASWLIQNR